MEKDCCDVPTSSHAADCADIVVIGGGLAGLSCGVALADAGLCVTVLEGSDALGGRARSWRHAASGDVIDIGPHVVHTEYANFLTFLGRLGTREHITWQPQPVLTIATQPAFRLRPHAVPPPFEVFPDMLHAPGLSLRDIVSNMRPSLRALQLNDRQMPAFDAMTGLQWLQSSGATQNMIDWFWRLAALATLNVPLERCSAAALMRVHGQVSGHRGFHFGFPQVGLSNLYVDQAVGAIESAGGRVVTGARAIRSEHNSGAHVVTTADDDRFAARYLVYALPPAELSAIDATLVRAGPIEPSPYKSVYLWFDRSITQERFWAQQPAPDRLNCDFYDLTRIRPGLKDRPSVIASNIVYSHKAENLSEETIVRRTIGEIAHFAPAVREARLVHADVHHIPMAIPCPLPGFETMRRTTITATPHVFLAGDWTHTDLPCSMESAVRSGYLAADAVLATEGRANNLAIAPRPYDAIAGWIQRRAQRP
jgi:squalene-associated FAD-dependent desaturase